jgi:hypothetical protein
MSHLARVLGTGKNGGEVGEVREVGTGRVTQELT